MGEDVATHTNENTYHSVTKLFKDYYPEFLAMGMSYDEYWYGDFELTRYYRKAYELKLERQYYDEWRQGIYVLEALLAASPAYREMGKGIEHEYPKQPLFGKLAKNTEKDDYTKMLENKQHFMELANRINDKMSKEA